MSGGMEYDGRVPAPVSASSGMLGFVVGMSATVAAVNSGLGGARAYLAVGVLGVGWGLILLSLKEVGHA